MNICISSFPAELDTALRDVAALFPNRFSGSGLPVSFRFDSGMKPGANRVTHTDGGGLSVVSGGITGALRALGRIMGAARDGAVAPFEETPCMDHVGIMPDCSRNAVMNVPTLKRYMLRCALMGVNTVMLYTEDTYEVPEEPYMGYLRGGYSCEQLRELDAYAAALGIEMLPCIQTLGHMEQFLKWKPNWKYRDNASILCPGDDDVYAFIERCIKAVSSCFRSRRIHVGMDEAWGLGTGNFKTRFGEKDPSAIMNEHLGRVCDICAKAGLAPIIWGDMFFQLATKTGNWYDVDGTLPPEVVAGIPKALTLMYWDYYHQKADDYTKFFDFYTNIGHTPSFAGGVYVWGRLWCALPFTLRITDAAMAACRARGINEAFVTLWGDDGAECDLESALPGIQHFAELAYSADGNVDAARRNANLFGSCGLDFDDWLLSAQIDTNRFFRDADRTPSNASKMLLWQDPMLAMYEPLTLPHPDLPSFYLDLADTLFKAAAKSPEAAMLERPARIAKIVGMKSNLRSRLRAAIVAKDRKAVADMVTHDVMPLRDEYVALWHEHRRRWMSTNTPFGWEVLESRYCSVIGRYDTMMMRLNAFADGELDTIPELEAELLNPWKDDSAVFPWGAYATAKTPSAIK